MTIMHLLSITAFIFMGALALSALQGAIAPLKQHIVKQTGCNDLSKFTLVKKPASTEAMYNKVNLA